MDPNAEIFIKLVEDVGLPKKPLSNIWKINLFIFLFNIVMSILIFKSSSLKFIPNLLTIIQVINVILAIVSIFIGIKILFNYQQRKNLHTRHDLYGAIAIVFGSVVIVLFFAIFTFF